MKLHGYIIHLCGSCTMCLCFVIHGQIFSFDALSCKISILTNISISFCQNFMKLHSYIVHLKFHYVHLFFICAKLCYKEGCLLGLTLGFFFFFLDCQMKHFPVSLTLSQMTNFRLFQTERFCRPQFHI